MSPNLTAIEMWALFRYLPIIVGDSISAEDAHWKRFLKLQEIVDIASGQCQNEQLLAHFPTEYAQLFPYLPIKPKQLFLIHFETAVRANGPLCDASCLKYQLRQNHVKRSTQVRNNYVNLARSVAFQFQYAALQAMKYDSFGSDDCEQTNQLQPI